MLGGGPAGAAAALTIAQAGGAVLLIAREERDRTRPAEILSPRARGRLAGAGLPEPADGCAECEGVLACWDGPAPDFTDYRLMQARPGLAVRRADLHQAFRGALLRAGVRLESLASRGAQLSVEPDGVAWREASGRERRIRADVTLIAAGRSAAASHDSGGRRVHESGAVALWFDFDHDSKAGTLLVEAAPGGWWYVPPRIDGRGSAVFVCDADLLPKDPAEQARQIRQSFDATRLVCMAATHPPSFHWSRGVDARAGYHGPAAWRTGARIGDAALSLDPLSGHGVSRAVEGAQLAAQLYLATGQVGAVYAEHIAAVRAYERRQHQALFRAAAARFPQCDYWRRRLPA